jgi:catechol-2,3-dioxygenase
MPVTDLNHLNLRAPLELLEKLRTFYCEIVGLEQGERPPFESFGYWLYARGKPILHLSSTGPGEHRDAGALNTYDHIAFSCGGLREMEAHLMARDIAYRKAAVPQTGMLQLFLRDPAGNGVELNFAPDDAI